MSSERDYRFLLEGPARIDARLASGRLELIGGEPGEALVTVRGRDADAVRVDTVGQRISISVEQRRMWHGGPYDITVVVPDRSEVAVRAASLDVDATLPLAALRSHLASGVLRAGDIDGDVSVKSASGDIDLRRVTGRVDVTSASGDVRIATCDGSLAVGTASGDVWVDRATKDVMLRSASGDLRVRRFAGPTMECRTVSGDIRVGLEPGRRVDVELNTLSGDIRNDFPVAGDRRSSTRVRAKSVSGSIFLHAAD